MFSFSLNCERTRKHRSAVSNFVPHGEQNFQNFVEKDSPSSRTTKSSLFSRSANFGNASPFLVGATKTLFVLIHPLLGGTEGTGFVGVLPLPLIFDPPLNVLDFTIYTTSNREATLKTALELLDATSRFAILPRNQSPCVSNSPT